MLRPIMTNWFADYHNMLLLRLLSLAVVFGVLWPGLILLLGFGLRSERAFPGAYGAARAHGRVTRCDGS
jgi:hypothetical protein